MRVPVRRRPNSPTLQIVATANFGVPTFSLADSQHQLHMIPAKNSIDLWYLVCNNDQHRVTLLCRLCEYLLTLTRDWVCFFGNPLWPPALDCCST
jgi:hypothetical protein